MFLGSFRPSFSGKGRIVLPKKLREEIAGNRIVLTRGFDKCLFGFDKREWENQARRHLQSPITEPQGRKLRRYFFSQAQVVELDDQGRFVIPVELLELVPIEDGPVLVGAGDHFEIWQETQWQKEAEKLGENYR